MRATIWLHNPIPGHISEENHILKDTYTPTFIATLFIIAKTWNQPKCPSIEEWLKKVWNIYTINTGLAKKVYTGCKMLQKEFQMNVLANPILLSYKKEWNHAICISMNWPRDNHTKWSKSDRESKTSYVINYMWNLKNCTNVIYTTELDPQAQKTNFQLPKGKGRGRINGELDRFTLPCTKEITNKDLLYRTGDSTQCFVIICKGKRIWKRIYMCMCVSWKHCVVHLN